MYKTCLYLSIVCVFLCCNIAMGQFMPAENSQLHYTMIGFSFPEFVQAQKYHIRIAKGKIYDETTFAAQTIINDSSFTNKKIIRVPDWGQEYTWQVIYQTPSKGLQKGLLNHFSTRKVPSVDTSAMRLAIMKKNNEYKHNYIFLDGNQALYNMEGCPVWYPPFLDSATNSISDLKLTQDGTITCLYGGNIYEISYSGEVLWKGPNTGEISGDKTENYHHEFTKLSNGHYMALGSSYVSWDPPSTDTMACEASSRNRDQKMMLPILIEYDKKGKVVWSWKFADEYNLCELPYEIADKQLRMPDPHANAFFFDEKKKVVYMSLKYANQIISIQYPGKKSKSGRTLQKIGCTYSGQHCCRISRKGQLYLFNNNSCAEGYHPGIVVMNDKQKSWEYEFSAADLNMDAETERMTSRCRGGAGGSVVELSDGSFFVSLCSPLSGLYIVGPDRTVRWSAIPQRYEPVNDSWHYALQYRASIITSQSDIDRMIWYGQKKAIGKDIVYKR